MSGAPRAPEGWDTDLCFSECPKNDTLEGGETAFGAGLGFGMRKPEPIGGSPRCLARVKISHSLIPRYGW